MGKALPPRLVNKKFESFVGTKRGAKDKTAKDPPRIAPWIIYALLGLVVLGMVASFFEAKRLNPL